MIDQSSSLVYHFSMSLFFEARERQILKQAWDVLAPRVEGWLLAESNDEQTESGLNREDPSPEHETRLYWKDFIEPVKEVLAAAPGHRLTLEQVHKAIEQKLASKMTARDRKMLSSGVIRWKTFVNQVGVELRKQRYLDPNEDRGVWRVMTPSEA